MTPGQNSAVRSECKKNATQDRHLLEATVYSKLHDRCTCNQVLLTNFQICRASCLLYKADLRET